MSITTMNKEFHLKPTFTFQRTNQRQAWDFVSVKMKDMCSRYIPGDLAFVWMTRSVFFSEDWAVDSARWSSLHGFGVFR